MIDNADLVLDATDNMEIRYLINDACVKHNVPWIYAGVIGAAGMTMNIIPGKTACFRCLMQTPPEPGTMPICETVGVLNGAPGLKWLFWRAKKDSGWFWKQIQIL